MKRREFLTLLGAATASTTPLSALAQQPAMPVVGILSGTNREPRLVGAIQQGLAESGYTGGPQCRPRISFRRRPLRTAARVGGRSGAAGGGGHRRHAKRCRPEAAKAVTSSIPIVFSIGGDPVKLGSCGKPQPAGRQRHRCDLSGQYTLAAKRLELLRELVPAGATIGLLFNPKIRRPGRKETTCWRRRANCISDSCRDRRQRK